MERWKLEDRHRQGEENIRSVEGIVKYIYIYIKLRDMNKVYLMRRWINLHIFEGGSTVSHINELSFVEINFED